jgi:hypothetical protein
MITKGGFMFNIGGCKIKLIKSRTSNLYDVNTNQFLKTCIAQNFVSSPSLILGEKPRIICVDVSPQTKVPIYHYFPLHKNFFMYFANHNKIVNRQQVEGFLRFVIENDIYSFETNIGGGISLININQHLEELIRDKDRIVSIYTLSNCFAEYLSCECKDYVLNDYYNTNGLESYKKSKILNIPLFFNIVEKERKFNVVGVVDKNKIQDIRLIPDNYYKYVISNRLDYFRQIVINNIGDIFDVPPWIYPKSDLQHQMLLELYKIKRHELLHNYKYMFLLKSRGSNRACLYPLNINIFERLDIDELEPNEVELLSDYFLVPISQLKHKHIHFMPIEEIGRSFLLLDNDVLLHRYSTDPPNNWNGVNSYLYVEK